METKKIIIAYIPVLHKGYLELIERHRDADALFIFGDEITKDYYQLSKEIRALDPKLIKKAIESV